MYLSYELEVAANEYGQDMPDRPGTFCRYDVSLWPVADLTSDATLAALGLTRNEVSAAWKEQLSRGERPSTWAIAEKLMKMGYVGALYELVVSQNRPPNRLTPSVNLVVWHWTSTGSDQLVQALDPTGDLPRDKSSWPTP